MQHHRADNLLSTYISDLILIIIVIFVLVFIINCWFDLAEAGIPYVDDSGRYADFHSLLHTTDSLLAASGIHPKVAQAIMRHSKVDLTLSRYSHIYSG